MNITEKLSEIQQKLKTKKSRYNSFGKYNFRSAEDILEAIKPFEKELGVAVTITETLITDGAFPIIESKATLTDCTLNKEGGYDEVYATAIVGVDLDQKGMQMPQKFGSASSYGKKYSLGNLFLIDDTADPDAANNHDKTKPELKGASFTKALAAVKEGSFKVADLEKRYTISDANLKKLKAAGK